MSTIDLESVKRSVTEKILTDLNDNYHKYTKANRIRFQLALLKLLFDKEQQVVPQNTVLQIFQTIKAQGFDAVEAVYGTKENGRHST